MEQGKKLDVYLGNDDKLHWDIYAKNLRQIILGCDSYPRSNDNLSYVIGIDSPWGTGKTYFTSMFSNYLQGYYYRPGSTTQAVETPKTCSVVYYDAWENDSDPDPVLSLVYEIIRSINVDYSFKDNLNIFKLSTQIVDFLTGKNTSEILDKLRGDNPLDVITQQKNLHDLTG